MKKPVRPRLTLDRETIAPMLLDQVTGAGRGVIADLTTMTTATSATTATTAFQTRWCKPGKPK